MDLEVILFSVVSSSRSGCPGNPVAAHVAVKALPVREAGFLRRKPCLFQEGGEKAVHIILKQDLAVQIPGVLERPVEEFDIGEAECVRIKPVLGMGR